MANPEMERLIAALGPTATRKKGRTVVLVPSASVMAHNMTGRVITAESGQILQFAAALARMKKRPQSCKLTEQVSNKVFTAVVNTHGVAV